MKMQILNEDPLRKANGYHLSTKQPLHTTAAKVAKPEVIPTAVDPSIAWKFDGKKHNQGKLSKFIDSKF